MSAKPESYITFQPLPPGPATLKWSVVTKIKPQQIGTISWFGRWRKYCFNPAPDTVFEQVCLRDIADFIETKTREHYADRLEARH